MGNRAGSRIEVGWGQRRHGVRWGGPGSLVAAGTPDQLLINGVDALLINGTDVLEINNG